MSQRQGEGGGYVQRMEVIVKRKKSQGGGVRVDVNREVKLLCKFKKKLFFFLGGSGWGVGVGGGSGWM